MNRPTYWLLAVMLVAGVPLAGLAQQGAPVVKPPSPLRQVVPGVIQAVDPERQLGESFSRHDVVELMAFDPSFDWAKDVPFRQDVWALEFHFKPMRMVWVDIPQPGGHMQRKLIWYLVYSVTNTGKIMHPVQDAKLPYQTFEPRQTVEVKYVDKPIRFIPSFLLECHESVSDDSGFTKVYPDRVIPVAVGPIRMREDRNLRFYTSVEMCREIPFGETVWGVATWEDVDPLTDKFSVYIQGLTNAYRWSDEPGGYKKGDPLGKGRRLVQKTLRVNFWRPSDEYFEHEEEIRYGVPDELDYEWVWR